MPVTPTYPGVYVDHESFRPSRLVNLTATEYVVSGFALDCTQALSPVTLARAVRCSE